MRFTDWVTLDEVNVNAPAQPGLFQIKTDNSLLEYPTGKTAMFYYGFGANLKSGLKTFIAQILPKLGPPDNLLIRWMETQDYKERFEKQLYNFELQFGSLPHGNVLFLKL